MDLIPAVKKRFILRFGVKLSMHLIAIMRLLFAEDVFCKSIKPVHKLLLEDPTLRPGEAFYKDD